MCQSSVNSCETKYCFVNILTQTETLFVVCITGDYNDFLEFIKKLPAAPQPEVYGFHSNADITKENTEVNRLLASLLLVVPMEDNKKKGKREEEEKERERAAAKDKENEAVSTTKEVKDKTEKEIGPMTSEEVMQSISIDILQKLPNNFDIEQAQIKYPTTYYQSMNTVLCQVNILLDHLLKCDTGYI